MRDWDRFERMAIRVYRGGRAGLRTRLYFRVLRRRLARDYPAWQEAFADHWRGLLVAGNALERDPFSALLAIEDASAIVDNWAALQLLPAAREALNKYLVQQVGRSDGHESPEGQV